MSGFSTLYLLEAKLLRQDVWMANLSATIIMIIVLGMATYVQKKHMALNMSDIIELLFGKWLGKLVLSVYLLGFMGLGILSLRSLSWFYTSAILPNTSPVLIMLLVSIVTTYAVSLGLGSIVRSVQVILPFFLAGILVIGILSVRDVDINPFLPQFQSRPSLILYGTMVSFGFPFGKSNVMAFLFSEVKNPKKIFASCSVGVAFSCLYLLMSTYLSMGSLGLNLFRTASFPFFSTIQLVRFGAYLERIEIMIIGIWTIFTLFEIIIVQHVFVKVMGTMFALKETKAFILPVGVLFLAVAAKSFRHLTDLMAYDYKILPFSIIPPVLIVNLLLVILTWVRKRKRGIQQVKP
jgi:spore germination protein (amino acid permease)